MELVITLACLAITAALVTPMIGDSATWQLRAAAEILVADLDYAWADSLAHRDDPRSILIDGDGRGYAIVAQSNPASGEGQALYAPITNPIGNSPYVTRFGAGRAAALARVQISGHGLGDDNRLGFGVHGELDQTSPATITLSVGSRQLTVTLDPDTGEPRVGAIE